MVFCVTDPDEEPVAKMPPPWRATFWRSVFFANVGLELRKRSPPPYEPVLPAKVFSSIRPVEPPDRSAAPP
jgi:hypothetical protein